MSLLLVLNLCLPVAQLAHQIAHLQHHGSCADGGAAPGAPHLSALDDQDEAHCQLCQLLNTRPDIAPTIASPPLPDAGPAFRISPAAAAQGFSPGSQATTYARGPPRVA